MLANKRKYRKVFYKGDRVYYVSYKGFRIYGTVKNTFRNLVLIRENNQSYLSDSWHNRKKVFLNISIT